MLLIFDKMLLSQPCICSCSEVALPPFTCGSMIVARISTSSSSRKRQAFEPASGVHSRTSPLECCRNIAHTQTSRLYPTSAPTISVSSKELLECLPRTFLITSKHTRISHLPRKHPALATNATYLHAPAAVSGRVVPGPPPATTPSCSATRSAPSTSAGASSGTSSRCCSRGSPTTALQSHRGQQWHHASGQQHDASSWTCQ